MTFVPSEVFKSILRLGLDRGLDLGPGGVECLWLDRGEPSPHRNYLTILLTAIYRRINQPQLCE